MDFATAAAIRNARRRSAFQAEKKRSMLYWEWWCGAVDNRGTRSRQATSCEMCIATLPRNYMTIHSDCDTSVPSTVLTFAKCCIRLPWLSTRGSSPFCGNRLPSNNPTSGPFILQHLFLYKSATFLFASFSMFFLNKKARGLLSSKKTCPTTCPFSRHVAPPFWLDFFFFRRKLPPIHRAADQTCMA